MKSAGWSVGLGIVLGAAGWGCGTPAHLTEGFGESYRTVYSRQAIRPPQQCAEPVTGLDSQEAAIISESYRRSLAPKGQSTDEEQSLIYMAPRLQGSQQKPLPPPSVPQDQR